jgi:hypothetical protein
VKCLPIPGEKLNNVLVCVMSLLVSILISAEHIRNCKVQHLKVWLNVFYVLSYCHFKARHSVFK